MKVRELEQYLDIDIDGSLARFSGMEALYARFLKKIPEDRTFDTLTEAVQNNDRKEIEMTAHTLKGMYGNLGLTGLYEKSDALVRAVREDRMEEVEPLYAEIRVLMEKAVNVLKELD